MFYHENQFKIAWKTQIWESQFRIDFAGGDMQAKNVPICENPRKIFKNPKPGGQGTPAVQRWAPVFSELGEILILVGRAKKKIFLARSRLAETALFNHNSNWFS